MLEYSMALGVLKPKGRGREKACPCAVFFAQPPSGKGEQEKPTSNNSPKSQGKGLVRTRAGKAALHFASGWVEVQRTLQLKLHRPLHNLSILTCASALVSPCGSQANEGIQHGSKGKLSKPAPQQPQMAAIRWNDEEGKKFGGLQEGVALALNKVPTQQLRALA
eukprot:1142087-Pelagomonas_calceolata.AAC.9